MSNWCLARTREKFIDVFNALILLVFCCLSNPVSGLFLGAIRTNKELIHGYRIRVRLSLVGVEIINVISSNNSRFITWQSSSKFCLIESNQATAFDELFQSETIFKRFSKCRHFKIQDKVAVRAQSWQTENNSIDSSKSMKWNSAKIHNSLWFLTIAGVRKSKRGFIHQFQNINNCTTNCYERVMTSFKEHSAYIMIRCLRGS